MAAGQRSAVCHVPAALRHRPGYLCIPPSLLGLRRLHVHRRTSQLTGQHRYPAPPPSVSPPAPAPPPGPPPAAFPSRPHVQRLGERPLRLLPVVLRRRPFSARLLAVVVFDLGAGKDQGTVGFRTGLRTGQRVAGDGPSARVRLSSQYSRSKAPPGSHEAVNCCKLGVR